MSTFHEGQEVEVLTRLEYGGARSYLFWRRAKIEHGYWFKEGFRYRVQFPDGTSAIFDRGAHMRLRRVRPTTDWDRGSPGDPLPGETLQQWSERARNGGFLPYPRAL